MISGELPTAQLPKCNKNTVWILLIKKWFSFVNEFNLWLKASFELVMLHDQHRRWATRASRTDQTFRVSLQLYNIFKWNWNADWAFSAPDLFRSGLAYGNLVQKNCGDDDHRYMANDYLFHRSLRFNLFDWLLSLTFNQSNRAMWGERVLDILCIHSCHIPQSYLIQNE